jgi:tryptophan synthase alpha chain
MITSQTGLDLVQQTFERARAENRATFMPFFTVGFPNKEASLNVLLALVDAGADALEIGIPFSDPLADGPTIQHAAQVALDNGTKVRDCIETVRALRERGVTIPLILMGYLNPVFAYGIERYIEDAAAAGASGFIVPDLPPGEGDESAAFAAGCEKHGLALIPLLAPTSTPERIRQVTNNARGFIYLVSVTGVTGARNALPTDISDYVRRVRSLTTLPLIVGFGISKPEQVQMLSQMVDGVVVASALIRLMETEGIDSVRKLAADLRAACG